MLNVLEFGSSSLASSEHSVKVRDIVSSDDTREFVVVSLRARHSRLSEAIR